jgi:hypothetical protein
MARVIIHVEGKTEKDFVDKVLAPYLYQNGYSTVSAKLLGNARQTTKRGGIRSWSSARNDIINHLKQDRGCLVTTMVDYYALPSTGSKKWPGREESKRLPFSQKAINIEQLLMSDIRKELGEDFYPFNFFPYIIMHEFEGMLFSDCDLFGEGVSRPDLIPTFQAIRNQFTTPEEINDSPYTAPSKRIKALIPGYQKIIMGRRAIETIGLETIRNECPHFREWLEYLESWPTTSVKS